MTTIDFGKATNRLFTIIINNAQTIGSKKFADIPLELLEIGEYQRVDFYSKAKVNGIAANFNKNLMDPLTVSPHPEEGKFYVVNGMHRMEAAKIIGLETIECEILQGLSDIPEERLVEEADIFRKQTEGTDPMSPAAVHKANIICGDEASINLDNVVKKYGIMYKTNNRKGMCEANVLTGFSVALRTTKWRGVKMIDSIMYVLNRSMWQMETGGLSNFAISMIRNLLVYDSEIFNNLDIVTSVIREYSPRLFKAKAIAKYERRGVDVACSLYLEDLVSEVLPIDRNVHLKYNVA